MKLPNKLTKLPNSFAKCNIIDKTKLILERPAELWGKARTAKEQPRGPNSKNPSTFSRLGFSCFLVYGESCSFFE
jgi:hypothetical protein